MRLRLKEILLERVRRSGFQQLDEHHQQLSAEGFICALKACGVSKELESGRRIHENAARSGRIASVYVANSLIDMYAKCGSVSEAHSVFNRMPCHSLVSWNALLLGLASNGEGTLALELFTRLINDQSSQAPDARTFLAAIVATTSAAGKEPGEAIQGRIVKVDCLQKGMEIHSQAAKLGFDSDLFVLSSLIDMYTKCGSLADAVRVFNSLARRNDVVLWNALILGYVTSGEEEKALELFGRMQENSEECSPNARTFVAALMACASLAEKKKDVRKLVLEKGNGIHLLIKEKKTMNYCCDLDEFVWNTLVDMYSKCGSMTQAWEVFRKMPQHDLVSWNALMMGYASNDDPDEALELFQQIVLQLRRGDGRTFIAALRACASLAAGEEARRDEGEFVKVCSLEKGRRIHCLAAKFGCDLDVFVCSSLVDMYSKCGSMVDARGVFDRIVSSENGEGELALEAFSNMKREGVCALNARTYVAALMACGNLSAEEQGKQVGDKIVKMASLERGMKIHAEAAEKGCDLDVFVASSLVCMYAKCGSLFDARCAFDKTISRDLVLWNALIVCYVENGEADLTLELIERLGIEGFAADTRTYVSAFMACSILAEGEEGKQVEDRVLKLKCLEKTMDLHSRAARNGHDTDVYVRNTLLDLYAKCGSLLDARMVFDRMTAQTLVSWNSLLLGYVENGESSLALEAFGWMRCNGSLEVDDRTFVAVLKACSCLGALQLGRKIHGEICKAGLEIDPYVANALVDFYGKCGSMDDAGRVFDSMQLRDTVSWSAIICGFSHNGDVESVFGMFSRMREEGLEANKVTYLAVLTSCSHAGLVEEGRECFEKMSSSSSSVKPDREHYHCVVDLFGRANRLEEAVGVVKRMPFEASVVTWSTVLGACCKWKNVEVGRIAFEALVRLDGNVAATYVAMGNIYGTRSE